MATTRRRARRNRPPDRRKKRRSGGRYKIQARALDRYISQQRKSARAWVTC